LRLPQFEPHGAAARTRDVDALLERVDAGHRAFHPDALADPMRQASGTAPHVEDARAFLEPEPLDKVLAPLELQIAEPIVRFRETAAVVRERSHHRSSHGSCGEPPRILTTLRAI